MQIMTFGNIFKKITALILISIVCFTLVFTSSEKRTSAAVLTGTSITLLSSALVGLLGALGVMVDKDYFSTDSISSWVSDYWDQGETLQNGYITFDVLGNMYVGSEMVKPLTDMVTDYMDENMFVNQVEINGIDCDFPCSVINLSEFPYVMEEVEVNNYSFVGVRYFLNKIPLNQLWGSNGVFFNAQDYITTNNSFEFGGFAYLTAEGNPNNGELFANGDIKFYFEDYIVDGDPHVVTWIDFDILSRNTLFPYSSYTYLVSKNFKSNEPVFCYVNGSVYLLPMFYGNSSDGSFYYYIDVPYSVPSYWAYNWYGDNGLLWTSESNKCYPRWRVTPTYEYSGRYAELLEKANALSGDLGGIVIHNDNWAGVSSEKELLQKGYDSLINSRDVEYSSEWEIIRSGEVISTADKTTSVEITQDTTATVVEDVKAVEKEYAEEIEATAEWKFSDYKVSGLAQWFPFCIPFDLYYIISIFNADPQAPYFIFPVELGENFGFFPIEIDLGLFETVAEIFRIMMFILFLIGLTLWTRHLIRG